MGNYVEGSPVVLVDDSVIGSHVWTGHEGTYIRSRTEADVSEDDAIRPFDHRIALAHPDGTVGLVWFYDEEVKHPWEV